MLLNIRVTTLEMTELKKIATSFGYNLSAYVKRRLFTENEDFNDKEILYLNPSLKKSNLLTVTMLCKMLYLQLKILEKQGYSSEEITALEKKSLEYARAQREKQGYRIINKANIGDLSDG